MRLIWPFSKARLLFFPLMISIFTPLIPFLSLSGSSRRPHRTTFSVTSRPPLRHFLAWVFAEPQLCRRFLQMAPIVCAKNEAYGLVQHLGSQSICNVGFGFPTIGSSQLRDLATQPDLINSLPFHSYFSPCIFYPLLPLASLKHPSFLIFISYL